MDYKDVIESKYNRQNWLLLLRDIFVAQNNASCPSAVSMRLVAGIVSWPKLSFHER